MAKITRYNGNLEAPASAALGTERTIFGTGSQSDDLTDQFNAFLLRGWGIVGPSDQPTLQDFNAMVFTLGQIHAYLHQMGVAEYNAAQEYHTGSITNVAGVLYVSLIDNNIGNTPASSPAQWSHQSGHGMVVLTTTQSWPVPAAMQLGVITPKVTVIGGGGGGGPSVSANGGGGGGGGGFTQSVLDLSGTATVSVTIGAGGASGVTGGVSSFGALLSASGGGGGTGGAGPGPGGGGTGSLGALNKSLGAGFQRAISGSIVTSGKGGGEGGGGEVESTSSSVNGIMAVAPGCGGSGGVYGGIGGAGRAGVVIIEW